MSEYTKGPWQWMVEDVSMASLHGPDGEEDHVMSSSPCDSCIKRAGNGEWAWGRCCCPSEANARLIAAAPEMYEALKEAICWMRGEGTPASRWAKCETESESMVMIQNAIAKAEGK